MQCQGSAKYARYEPLSVMVVAMLWDCHRGTGGKKKGVVDPRLKDKDVSVYLGLALAVQFLCRCD